jgi:hypothetical protein
MGAPINFHGYCPKVDAPAHFYDVGNPDQWNEFVIEPKYASEKGKKWEKKQTRYVSHTMPVGANVIPADDDGIHQINGWKFHY